MTRPTIINNLGFTNPAEFDPATPDKRVFPTEGGYETTRKRDQRKHDERTRAASLSGPCRELSPEEITRLYGESR